MDENPAAAARPPQRSAGLDAIRTLAIALVIVHHLRHLPGAPEWLRWFGLRAYVGVDLFFVLSGWLIGGQLWRELQQTGRVQLFRFWRRRWLRTIPAYFATLALLLLARRLTVGDLAPMLVFLQNHLHPGAWFTSWSLCIEEQFYLVLPLIAPLTIAGGARGEATATSRALPVRAALIAATAVLLSPALRAASYPSIAVASYDTFLERFYVGTHLRLDGLAMGVGLAALATFRPLVWSGILARAATLGGVGLVLLTSQWWPWLTGAGSDGPQRQLAYNAVGGFFVVSLATALLLPVALRWTAPRWLARALEVAADHAYTLYLTHEFARDAAYGGLTQWNGGRPPPFVLSLAAATAAIALAAWMMRVLIEQPVLAWRARLEGPRSAPTG